MTLSMGSGVMVDANVVSYIMRGALRHGVSLVTHNASDFEEITGLQIITEYQ